MTFHICCRDCRFEGLEGDGEEADRIRETHESDTGHDVVSERVDGSARMVTDGGHGTLRQTDEGIEIPDSINQLVTAGPHGFAAVDGPFLVDKDGTKWTITVPLEENDALAPSDAEMLTLKRMQKGESAVLIADGEAVGGGVIELTYEPDGEGERHIVVDQYSAGDL